MDIYINNTKIKDVRIFSMNNLINKLIDENSIKYYCSKIKVYESKDIHKNLLKTLDKIKTNPSGHIVDKITQTLKLKEFTNIMMFHRMYSIIAKYTKYTSSELILALDDDILEVLALYIDLKYHFPFVLNGYLYST